MAHPDIFNAHYLKREIRTRILDQLHAAGLDKDKYSAYLTGDLVTDRSKNYTPLQIVVCLEDQEADKFNEAIGKYLEHIEFPELKRSCQFAFQNGVINLEDHPGVYDIKNNVWFKGDPRDKKEGQASIPKSFWLDRSGNITSSSWGMRHEELAAELFPEAIGKNPYSFMGGQGFIRGDYYDGKFLIDVDLIPGGVEITPSQRKVLEKLAFNLEKKVVVIDGMGRETLLFDPIPEEKREGQFNKSDYQSFWLSPANRLFNVGEHYELLPTILGASWNKEKASDDYDYIIERYHDAYAKGWVRLVIALGEIMYVGNPSSKQLKELKDLAIEKGGPEGALTVRMGQKIFDSASVPTNQPKVTSVEITLPKGTSFQAFEQTLKDHWKYMAKVSQGPDGKALVKIWDSTLKDFDQFLKNYHSFEGVIKPNVAPKTDPREAYQSFDILLPLGIKKHHLQTFLEAEKAPPYIADDLGNKSLRITCFAQDKARLEELCGFFLHPQKENHEPPVPAKVTAPKAENVLKVDLSSVPQKEFKDFIDNYNIDRQQGFEITPLTEDTIQTTTQAQRGVLETILKKKFPGIRVAVNIYYKIPNDPETRIYDFYVAEQLYYLLKAGPPETRSFKELDPSDSDYVSIEEAVNELTSYLRTELMSNIFQAVAGEMRHLNSFGTAKKDPTIQKYFQNLAVRQQKPSLTGKKDPADRVTQKGLDSSASRAAPIAAAFDTIKESSPEDFMRGAKEAFANGSWSSSYGGKPWAGIAHGWLMLKNAKNTNDLIIAIDHVLDLEHNNDTFFDKIPKYSKSGYDWVKKALDFKYEADLPSLIGKASSSMKSMARRLVNRYNPNLMKTREELARGVGKKEEPIKPEEVQKPIASSGDLVVAADDVDASGKYKHKIPSLIEGNLIINVDVYFPGSIYSEGSISSKGNISSKGVYIKSVLQKLENGKLLPSPENPDPQKKPAADEYKNEPGFKKGDLVTPKYDHDGATKGTNYIVTAVKGAQFNLGAAGPFYEENFDKIEGIGKTPEEVKALTSVKGLKPGDSVLAQFDFDKGGNGTNIHKGGVYEILKVDESDNSICLKVCPSYHWLLKFHPFTKAPPAQPAQPDMIGEEPVSNLTGDDIIVGDKVKCINASGMGKTLIQVGKVYTVSGKKAVPSGTVIYLEELSPGHSFSTKRFEKADADLSGLSVEGNKFEAGDFVKCIQAEPGLDVGQMYTVESICHECKEPAIYLKGKHDPYFESYFALVGAQKESTEVKYGPSQVTQNPFKVGDQVSLVGTGDKFYTVKALSGINGVYLEGISSPVNVKALALVAAASDHDKPKDNPLNLTPASLETYNNVKAIFPDAKPGHRVNQQFIPLDVSVDEWEKHYGKFPEGEKLGTHTTNDGLVWYWYNGSVIFAKLNLAGKKEALRLASAFIRDIKFSELPKDTQKDIEQFYPCDKNTLIPMLGMVVDELIHKADPHNLSSAREHIKGESVKKLEKEVYEKSESKYLLLVNDSLIDGHHYLAKAEKAKVTRTLRVLDLTAIRFQKRKGVQLSNLLTGPLSDRWDKLRQASSTPKDLIAGARKINHCGDYGKLFYNPKTKAAYWVAGDADDTSMGFSSSEEIKKLLKVPGIKEVIVEYEGSPKEEDGYQKVEYRKGAQPEKIQEIAIKQNDVVVSGGRTHYECKKHAEEQGLDFQQPWEEGFITSSGRFVDRAEGYKLAEKAGQVWSDTENRLLHSYNVKRGQIDSSKIKIKRGYFEHLLNCLDNQKFIDELDPKTKKENQAIIDKAGQDGRKLLSIRIAKHEKTICVDMDGVIAKYDGWKGKTHFGEPEDGAKESLEELKEKGWTIIIYTTRGDNKLISKYLEENEIPFDFINKNPDQPKGSSHKPISDVYLDDRAIEFDNWKDALKEIGSKKIALSNRESQSGDDHINPVTPSEEILARLKELNIKFDGTMGGFGDIPLYFQLTDYNENSVTYKATFYVLATATLEEVMQKYNEIQEKFRSQQKGRIALSNRKGSSEREGKLNKDYPFVYIGNSYDGISIIFVTDSPITHAPRINYLIYPAYQVSTFEDSGLSGREWINKNPPNFNQVFHIDSKQGHDTTTRTEVVAPQAFNEKLESLVGSLEDVIKLPYDQVKNGIAILLDKTLAKHRELQYA